MVLVASERVALQNRPGPGIELMSLALAGGFLNTGPPEKPHFDLLTLVNSAAVKMVYVYLF